MGVEPVNVEDLNAGSETNSCSTVGIDDVKA